VVVFGDVVVVGVGVVIFGVVEVFDDDW